MYWLSDTILMNLIFTSDEMKKMEIALEVITL